MRDLIRQLRERRATRSVDELVRAVEAMVGGQLRVPAFQALYMDLNAVIPKTKGKDHDRLVGAWRKLKDWAIKKALGIKEWRLIEWVDRQPDYR